MEASGLMHPTHRGDRKTDVRRSQGPNGHRENNLSSCHAKSRCIGTKGLAGVNIGAMNLVRKMLRPDASGLSITVTAAHFVGCSPCGQLKLPAYDSCCPAVGSLWRKSHPPTGTTSSIEFRIASFGSYPRQAQAPLGHNVALDLAGTGGNGDGDVLQISPLQAPPQGRPARRRRKLSIQPQYL